MTHRERHRRARLAGAGATMDEEAWAKLVDRAAESMKERMPPIDFTGEGEIPVNRARPPTVILGPRQVAVNDRMVLECEAQLAGALDEVRRLREYVRDLEEIYQRGY